jgi:hypothetical protein
MGLWEAGRWFSGAFWFLLHNPGIKTMPFSLWLFLLWVPSGQYQSQGLSCGPGQGNNPCQKVPQGLHDNCRLVQPSLAGKNSFQPPWTWAGDKKESSCKEKARQSPYREG